MKEKPSFVEQFTSDDKELSEVRLSGSSPNSSKMVTEKGHFLWCTALFNIERTKILLLLKEISAGHWVDLEACWAVAHGKQPDVTCKRSWESWVVPTGIVLLFAHLPLLLLLFATLMDKDGSNPTSLSVPPFFELDRWTMNVSQPYSQTPL